MDDINHSTETWTNKHLSLKERFYIERRLRLGASISSIAADLQQSRSAFNIKKIITQNDL